MDSKIQTSHSLQKARGKAEHGMPRQWGAVGGNWGAPAATVLSLPACSLLDCHSPRQDTWGASLPWRAGISMTRGPFSSGERSG